MTTTRYGVHAGTEGSPIEDVLDYWRTVEALGFEWISVWDHFYPISGSEGAGSYDSVASHSALAMVTSRVRIGVLVYSVGYRRPAVLANAIATIDQLSGGRAEASLGAGWAKPEYDSYGLPFPELRERMDILAEGVECLAGLLHNERFSFEGNHFQLHDASVGMRPIQEHVPVWVGGLGREAGHPAGRRGSPTAGTRRWARRRRTTRARWRCSSARRRRSAVTPRRSGGRRTSASSATSASATSATVATRTRRCAEACCSARMTRCSTASRRTRAPAPTRSCSPARSPRAPSSWSASRGCWASNADCAARRRAVRSSLAVGYHLIAPEMNSSVIDTTATTATTAMPMRAFFDWCHGLDASVCSSYSRILRSWSFRF